MSRQRYSRFKSPPSSVDSPEPAADDSQPQDASSPPKRKRRRHLQRIPKKGAKKPRTKEQRTKESRGQWLEASHRFGGTPFGDIQLPQCALDFMMSLSFSKGLAEELREEILSLERPPGTF